MAQRALSRRLVVGGTSAALLAGVVGVVPLLGSAAAASCPTWSDATGDSAATLAPLGSDPTGLSSDDDMDIVSSTVGVLPDGGLTVVVQVAKLADAPAYTSGDQFDVSFKAAGTATTVTLHRDTQAGTSAASLDGGTAVDGKVAYDLKASTVTGTFTADQVKKSLGKALAGLKLDTFRTVASGYTETPAGGGAFPQVDDSDAPAALTYTDAGGCASGAGTTPTGTPTATATPTGTPTATATPSPTGATTSAPSVGKDGLYDQPRKGCASFTDPAGDADPTSTGGNNEAALDVLQVNLKSPSTGLQVYVHVADLAGGFNVPGEGGSWTTSFTIAGKAIAVAVDDAGKATATVAGKDNADLKPTALLDSKNSNVVVTLPKAGLEKVVGTSLTAGTAITGTAVATAVVTPLSEFGADQATGTKPAEKTYAYGDNSCFLPLPARLVLLRAAKSGAFTDTADVLAQLRDSAGAPAKGARVTGQVSGGRAVAGLTDASGYVRLFVPITVPASTRTLTVAFAGTPDLGTASVAQRFTVTAERTVLRGASLRRSVGVTLVDDEGKPLAGAPVLFTVGAKKYLVRTSSTGFARITGLAQGTLVKLSYAGRAGYFLAATSVWVKAA